MRRINLQYYILTISLNILTHHHESNFKSSPARPHLPALTRLPTADPHLSSQIGNSPPSGTNSND